MFHVGLNSSKEKRLQNAMKLSNLFLLHFILQKLFGAFPVLQLAKVEPDFKRVPIIKGVWKQKGEEGPEFFEIVLQRGSCEEEADADVPLRCRWRPEPPQNLEQSRFRVLKTVAFVLVKH